MPQPGLRAAAASAAERRHVKPPFDPYLSFAG
jgi:hypothetical protein